METMDASTSTSKDVKQNALENEGAKPSTHPFAFLARLIVDGISFRQRYDSFLEATGTLIESKDMRDPLNVKEFEMIMGVLDAFKQETAARMYAIDSFINRYKSSQTENQPPEQTSEASSQSKMQRDSITPQPEVLPGDRNTTGSPTADNGPAKSIQKRPYAKDGAAGIPDLMQLAVESKMPNRLKVKASHAAVMQMDQTFFKSCLMECGLCKRTMRKPDHETYATFCIECHCFVCFRCDCAKFHLSEQEGLVEEAERTTVRAAGKRRNRKKKKKDRKVAPEESRQDTPAEEIEKSTELRDGIPDLVDYLMKSGSMLDLADFIDQCESTGIDLDEGYIKDLHFPMS
jgi:hypothetical protein